MCNIDAIGKAPAAHVATRCRALDGKTWEQGKNMRFITAKGGYDFYKLRDLKYDLKYGYLSYSDAGAPMQSTDVLYHRASLAAANEMYEANALVETGDEPLTR